MQQFLSLLRRRGQDFQAWLWREPAPEESIILRFLRASFRVTLVFGREFFRDNILLRASALTFTVVLSVVPVLALSTAVLKGLGAGNELREAAYQFIETFEEDSGLNEPTLENDDGWGEGAIPEWTEQQPPTFAMHLKRAVDTIFNYVDRTNFTTLGILGIIGLFITVLMVLAAIEDAINAIWHAESGRPLGRRVMDYLALLLLLPLAINIGMAAMAALQSPNFVLNIERLSPVPWAGPVLINLLTFLFLVAILTIMYRFLPNTRVDFRPAITGGLVAGLGWLLVQAFYIKLQLGVARYNAIYGSFATLPLFFLWIYISWVVFLSGAEISYAVRVWRRYGLEQSKVTASSRLALAYDLLAIIYRDFKNRQPTDLASLSLPLGYDSSAVDQTLQDLVEAGLLRKTEAGNETLLPAGPAEEIRLAEVLQVLWGSVDRGSRGAELTAQILEGAAGALQDRNLQELLPETKAAGG